MTIFKQIIDKKIPSKIVFENERLLAIEDIAPRAPVHLLIMPKKEIKTFQEVSKEDMSLIQEIMETAQKLAIEFGVSNGYRLLVNNGDHAGQTVDHLHFHLIGGRPLGPMA